MALFVHLYMKSTNWLFFLNFFACAKKHTNFSYEKKSLDILLVSFFM